jgi:hypothetical protein
MGECQLCLGTRSSAPERRAGGRVNGLAEMLSQRLLPLAANRDYRPKSDIGQLNRAPTQVNYSRDHAVAWACKRVAPGFDSPSSTHRSPVARSVVVRRPFHAGRLPD